MPRAMGSPNSYMIPIPTWSKAGACLPSHLVLLEHALRFAIEEGGDPGIDTRTTRGCDYGQPTAQIFINPNSQLANPGFLGLCPFFGAPGKVVFHRVLEFLTQFLWRAAIEINDILDADDTPMEGIGRWIKRNMRVVVLVLE